MGYSLRCPSCRGKFPWNPTEGMPDICPLCEGKVGHDRADDDIVLPFIRSSGRSKIIDNVYRDMERGSEVRAAAAAEMAGVPVSEMSSLKITDMNDRQKPGDISAKLVQNDMTAIIDRHHAQLAAMGPELSRNVGVGDYPSQGAKIRSMVQNAHPDMVSRHCVGVDMLTK